jgi:branched-chain amino acid transport system permease protein
VKARARNLIALVGAPLFWGAIVLLAGVPYFVGSRFLIYLGTLIAIEAALATSLNLIVGYAGQFALAHAAFFGFGAYAASILVATYGVNFWLATLIALALAAVIAALIGYPALRYTGGIHFALLTFAFGELARLLAANWNDMTGGPMGLRVGFSLPPLAGIDLSSTRAMYGVALSIFVISLVAVAVLIRSRFGRALVAIREDETLAAFLGINVLGHKLLAFISSAVLAALAGTFYAPFMSFISPELLNAQEVIALIGILIVGGVGTLPGPVIGTLIFFGLPEFFHVARLYRLVSLGVVIVLVVLFMPKGIAGEARARFRVKR